METENSSPRRTQRGAEEQLPLEVINGISGQIVDAAMRVHSAIGPGLLESAYEACLAHELWHRGLLAEVQVPVPLFYRDLRMDVGYQADMIVEDVVVVELKAVAKLLPIYSAQMLTYLRLSRRRVGLMINFHEPHLKDGIKRFRIDC